MNRDLTPDESATLESLIDSTNLQSVIMALSEICGARAERIAADPAFASLARRWREAEGALGVLAVERHIGAVS